MGDFIYGVIKVFLISIIPIVILLGLGLIGLIWPWLKFIVYGVAGSHIHSYIMDNLANCIVS